ncbi:MAG: response regulator [Lachnospiraceae bacterium]|nr:response regulator [Lachnospiraceae bacterium]
MADYRKILIVDDDMMNIKMVKRALGIGAYTLYEATSGMKALETMQAVDFDLIILDIKMPVMDGIQVFEVMKKNKNLKDIPVIFLTAQNDIKDIKKALMLGAANYIVKPFLPMDLMSRVKEVLKTK